MSSYTAERFLEILNGRCCVENGDIRMRTEEERGGQASLLPIQQIVFKRPVELVIQGPCSSSIRSFEHHGSPEFPMGMCARCTREKNAPDKSWLHHVIEENDAKRILVFSDCCGQYGKQYQELLRTAFPGLTWIFPDVPDLYDNVMQNFRRLAYTLFREGIIGPAK